MGKSLVSCFFETQCRHENMCEQDYKATSDNDNRQRLVTLLNL